MISALMILHPSISQESAAVLTISSLLAPCLVQDMSHNFEEHEYSSAFTHLIICATAVDGENVFTWLDTHADLLKSCKEVCFVEISDDVEGDTWLLDKRFWQMETLAPPLADRFNAEDTLRAQDFALALLG